MKKSLIYFVYIPSIKLSHLVRTGIKRGELRNESEIEHLDFQNIGSPCDQEKIKSEKNMLIDISYKIFELKLTCQRKKEINDRYCKHQKDLLKHLKNEEKVINNLQQIRSYEHHIFLSSFLTQFINNCLKLLEESIGTKSKKFLKKKYIKNDNFTENKFNEEYNIKMLQSVEYFAHYSFKKINNVFDYLLLNEKVVVNYLDFCNKFKKAELIAQIDSLISNFIN